MSCGLSHLFSHMYVYGNSQRPVSHESDPDAQGYGTSSQNWWKINQPKYHPSCHLYDIKIGQAASSAQAVWCWADSLTQLVRPIPNRERMERAYRHTEVSVDGFSAASPQTKKDWDFGGEEKKKPSPDKSDSHFQCSELLFSQCLSTTYLTNVMLALWGGPEGRIEVLIHQAHGKLITQQGQSLPWLWF